jgi:hypothetical protein
VPDAQATVALENADTSWPVQLEDGQAMDGYRLVEVKVFSATKRKDRDHMDELATEWLKNHQSFDRLTAQVTLSSDLEYHCLTLTFMGWQKI